MILIKGPQSFRNRTYAYLLAMKRLEICSLLDWKFALSFDEMLIAWETVHVSRRWQCWMNLRKRNESLISCCQWRNWRGGRGVNCLLGKLNVKTGSPLS